MAANQVGKTVSAGAEVAFHMTGVYPDWWRGKRFDKPVVGWVSGVTSESTRDNPQRILLGRYTDIGTGMIPHAQLLEHVPARGIPESVDNIKVRHITGGTSVAYFKSYEKGREKWQGETLDFVWFDEEPPEDVYLEGLTRTNASNGTVFVTFTPLLGMSNVVTRFLIDKSPGTNITNMTIDDAEHFSPQRRAEILASYPEHEREARAYGHPVLGSGRVFPITEAAVREDAPPLQAIWTRICGQDIGWDHPTAFVWLAHDRDADVVHVYDTYRVREETPVIHAAAVKARGDWIPVAWPHDGLQHDKGSGEQMAQLYRAQGLAMLPERAQFEDGTIGLEAGIVMMLDRMKTGRLKVAAHLNDWWEEFRLYHRKDGIIVKERDDLMSATRIGLMMLRHAITAPEQRRQQPQLHHLGGAGWMR